MFETKYRVPRRVFADPGDPIKITYSPEFDKRGVMTLVETGKENLYDFIQSHRDSVDLHKIIERFERGDVTALSKVQAVYADLSEMPRTYSEMLNQVIAGEKMFNDLPISVKEKFGQNFNAWMSTMGSDEWLSNMGYTSSDPSPVDPSPVVPAPVVPIV